MSAALAAALALVRGWTRIYTAGMEPALRDGRRAEIDSDLWELHEDARRRGASPTRIAVHMPTRLLLGVGDDVGWRVDHVRAPALLGREALWLQIALKLVTP